MKKFVKGVRFAPKNYSDEVEAKIQHYKRKESVLGRFLKFFFSNSA